MATHNALKKKYELLLKKFKLDELDFLYKKEITSLSVHDINQCIHEMRLPQTIGSVAEVFFYLYERKQPNLEQLESTYYQIYTCDVALHRSRKLQWSAASVDCETRDLPETLDELDSIICRAYEAVEQDFIVNCYSKYLDKVVWTVIVPKTKLKKGGYKTRSPLIFAYKPTLEPPHFLFSPPKLDSDVHLKIYADCLGYEEYSLIGFEGSDAHELFECIDKGHHPGTEPMPIYLPALPGGSEMVVKRNNYIVDYSHAHERREYAEKVFPSNTRQYFKAVCEGTLRDPTGNHSRTRGKDEIEFLSSMEFQASGKTSVEEMLKHLVSIGAVALPLPEYMLNISTTPSNTATFENCTSLEKTTIARI